MESGGYSNDEQHIRIFRWLICNIDIIKICTHENWIPSLFSQRCQAHRHARAHFCLILHYMREFHYFNPTYKGCADPGSMSQVTGSHHMRVPCVWIGRCWECWYLPRLWIVIETKGQHSPMRAITSLDHCLFMKLYETNTDFDHVACVLHAYDRTTRNQNGWEQ